MDRGIEMNDPKGRKQIGFERHIFVCENSRNSDHPRGCCLEKGGDSIRTFFKKEIIEHNLSGKVRANSAGCLDFCERGPVVVIYPEGTWYKIDNPETDVKEIIELHCIQGKIVERCEINLE